ncbi:MAG: type I-E CRISPR-associated protein Cas7/Cse4/CasC [Proteobacteria bacterium]|nr:type I-E CRISPR-associated protein Cas7/Cse4/CasC [Pseudomonadota bacterium]
MSNLYVDIHVLQTVPPSCVNRDDTGSPKTAVYGGVTRARVSSQCWKNAVRSMFRDILPKDEVGVRTKHICQLVADEITRLGGKDAYKKAEKILSAGKLQLKADKKNAEELLTGALYFISDAQIKALAKLAIENPAAKTADVQAIMNAEPSIDIALFGRMVADDPSLNTDACCQVAHSISTHKVSNEYDDFTAQDDCRPDDNAGAGMIGTVEYNSSTLYRYATIAVHALKDNLKDKTAEAVRVFTDAFIRSMPTGKLNTFANRTIPDAVMVTIRTDQPVNLVGAFEKPVKSGDNGFISESCNKLAEHAKNTYDKWLDAPVACYVISKNDELNSLGDDVSLKEMLSKLESELTRRLSA